MRIGGKKLIVYHQINTRTSAGSREDFYSVIIKTLEDRSFQKLKRCKECSRFFIADRLNDKFCRPECSKIYFDRGAGDRVRESRKNKTAESEQRSRKNQSMKRSATKLKRKRRK